MQEYISDIEIRRQAWKYLAAPILWLAYAFLLPFLWAKLGPWSLLVMIFPGAWLYNWLSYLAHESWHRYVPNINNDRFFKHAFCLLGADPQLYRLVHGRHHSQIHTWQDTEFHPLGRIRSRPLRALYNILEIAFGVIFIFALLSWVVPRHPQYRHRYSKSAAAVALLSIAAIYGTLGLAAALAFNLSAAQVLIPWLLSLWISAVIVHQDQMIQHAGIILDGDVRQRDLATRNLRPAGPASRLLLFLFHNDPREHVLHHTLVRVYHRPFPDR
ncbi:MAG: fatty acid desaturase, partial [Phycisphaerae bacterium]|nr:fatty acid desaturase [Phycisphaerae bacterium]